MKEGFSQEYDDLMKKIKEVEATVDVGMKKIMVPRIRIMGNMTTEKGLRLWGWFRQGIKNGRPETVNGLPKYYHEKDKDITMKWERHQGYRFLNSWHPHASGWIIGARHHGRAFLWQDGRQIFPGRHANMHTRKWHGYPPDKDPRSPWAEFLYTRNYKLYVVSHEWVEEIVPGEDMETFPQTKYYPNPRPVTEYYVVNDSKKSHQQHDELAKSIGWELVPINSKEDLQKLRDVTSLPVWVASTSKYIPGITIIDGENIKTEEEFNTYAGDLKCPHIDDKNINLVRYNIDVDKCVTARPAVYKRSIIPDYQAIADHETLLTQLYKDIDTLKEIQKERYNTEYSYDEPTFKELEDQYGEFTEGFENQEGFRGDTLEDAYEAGKARVSELKRKLLRNKTIMAPRTRVYNTYFYKYNEVQKNTSDVKKETKFWLTENKENVKNDIRHVEGQTAQITEKFDPYKEYFAMAKRENTYMFKDYDKLRYINRYVLIWVYFALLLILFAIVTMRSGHISDYPFYLFFSFLVLFPFIIYPFQQAMMYIFKKIYTTVSTNKLSNALS